tara:strand:+ start:11751 stop:11867 length:117 start_codon:yes stop_codon:yes gene_type:complete
MALNPQKVEELEKTMKDWLKDVVAQFPAPNPNYNPEKK